MPYDKKQSLLGSSMMVGLQALALVAILAGCKENNPEQKVVERYLELRKESRVEMVKTPIAPFVDQQIDPKHAEMYAEVFRSLEFDRPLTKQQYLHDLGEPLRDYKITKVEKIQDGSTQVSATISFPDPRAFNRILPMQEVYEFETVAQEANRQRDASRLATFEAAAAELVERYNRELEQALKVEAVSDSVTYVVRPVNGLAKLFINETKSELKRKSDEADSVRIAKEISHLRLLEPTGKYYRYDGGQVFLTGRVQNHGKETISAMTGVTVHAELLGQDTNPVAKQRTFLTLNRSIPEGETTDYLIRFDGINDLNWSGKYRLRLGNLDQKIASPWQEFTAGKR